MPGYYDCITCGPLDMEYHDARDAGDAVDAVCYDVHSGTAFAITSPNPAKKADGDCYWYGLNGHNDANGICPTRSTANAHADEPPRYIPPLAGQMGFDGSVVGR